MTFIKNRKLIGITWIFAFLFLVICLLTMAYSYFNTEEMSLAVDQCYKNGGEVVLEINNHLTNSYSFECK